MYAGQTFQMDQMYDATHMVVRGRCEDRPAVCPIDIDNWLIP